MPLLETNNTHIVLASQSPRRIELLKKILTRFEVQASEINEDIDQPDPVKFVSQISKQKAEVVSRNYDKSLIIGADSIVVRNGHILGKPKDENEAIDMLKFLSGQTHRVYTGFTILENKGEKIVTDYEVTEVKFRDLQNWEIEKYIKEEKPFDKAGSYGIQDSSAVFVDWIHGCYFNVVGLPIAKLYRSLLPFFLP